MDAAFRRYRLMSFVTGSTLLSLFATLALHAIDLHLWQDINVLVRVDGIAHGLILFPIYMVMSFQFVLKAKLPLYILVTMLLAGFVPGVAFLVEYLLAKKVYPQGIPPRISQQK